MPRGIAQLAFRFVLIIGIVNLFADLTYEGGRSINGPFLGSLGASSGIVGVVAGLGELLGYGLRSVSGYIADRTRQYWLVVFVGYFINMLAVPALGLAGTWPVASGLIVAERTGRAIRRPAVESMISHAGKSLGSGWVFGLNEAMDQGGATVGPLIIALILYRKEGYHHAYASLLIPALLCLGMVVVARVFYPRPHELEGTDEEGEENAANLLAAKGFSEAYWRYVAAGALIAAGFADFALIGFHFQKAATVSQDIVPVFYAVAMGVGALASLVVGRMLDRFGIPVLIAALLLSAFFAPLVFLGGPAVALIGMILWGIGMAVQDSSLKAVLVDVVPRQRRSTAFGVFDTSFGISWFLGSAIMGLLYSRSLVALTVFSVVLQVAAIPVLMSANRKRNGNR